MFTINNAKFASFTAAANCAVVHARQRGECLVRSNCGTLIADFRLMSDGTVSIAATDAGKKLVEGLA